MQSCECMTNVLLLLLVVVVVVVVLVLLMLLLPLLLLLLLLLLLQCRASMLEMNLNKWDQDLDSTMSSSSNSSDSGKRTRLFALTGFLSHLNVKMIILPRQARDKHRESTQKESPRFLIDGDDAGCESYIMGAQRRNQTGRPVCPLISFFFELFLSPWLSRACLGNSPCVSSSMTTHADAKRRTSSAQE